MDMRPLKYSENPKLANDHKRNNLWIRGKTNGSHFITCSALQGASHVNREIHTGSLPRLGQRPSVIIGGGSRSVGQGRGGGGSCIFGRLEPFLLHFSIVSIERRLAKAVFKESTAIDATA